MKSIKSKAKSIAAIAAAVMLSASITATTVSAADGYYYPNSYYSGGYSQTSASLSNNRIPNMIYMTQYTSGAAARQAKAQAAVTAASGLLAQVKVDNLGGVSAPSFANLNLYISSTKYDYLIKANAENGATVLTFNSQSALSSAMNKIKTEEQNIINAALQPYRDYVTNIINSGVYTKTNGNTDPALGDKLANAAMLNAAKEALNCVYTDLELFSGDVTGRTKTYQIAYLSEASIGNSSTQTVVSNDEEFTNFPKLILNGQTVGWDSVHHLDIFNNSNNSWWFALKDGNTLNNDYYWLGGMMIPDFNTTISFDAYAGRDWAQYGASPNGSNNNNNNWNNNVQTRSYYYNQSYNYPSDYIYQVTNGSSTYYYPNVEYARAACSASSGWYIGNVYSANVNTYSGRYFCFIDGQYYQNTSQSAYPSDTVLLSSSNISSYGNYYINNGIVYDNRGNNLGAASSRGYNINSTWFCTDNGWFYASPQSGLNGYYVPASSLSYGNYYVSSGYVYDGNGNNLGTAVSRGYNNYATWFCTDDGKFYNVPQNGKRGYTVSQSDTSTVDMSDPYYQYWTMRVEQLKKEQADKTNKPDTSNKNDTSNTGNTGNKNTGTVNKPASSEDIIVSDNSLFVSAEDLAAIRASGDTITVNYTKKIKWTFSGENVKTPKDINCRVTYNTKNVPKPLIAAIRTDEVTNVYQMTIGENLAFGSNASLQIKFSEKKANFVAKLYRYDTATGSLVYINTATVGNSGYTTFNNIDHGGDFVITLG